MGVGEAKHDVLGPRGRHRAAGGDLRPAAERAPGPQVDRVVQDPRGDAGGRRRDAARRPHVGVRRPAVSIAIPRIRDFRGLNPRSFDGRGNYSLGIREQLIFPEIDYDSIDEVRGPRRDDHDERPDRRGGLRAPPRARLPVLPGGAARAGRPRGRGGGAPARGGPPARRGRGRPPSSSSRRRTRRHTRSACAPRKGEEGEEGEARARKAPRARRPAEEESRVIGKDFTESSTAAQAQVQDPGLQSMPALRAGRAPTTASSASAGCACASSRTRATSPG